MWKQYFQTVAQSQPTLDWRVSQEDIQVGLVWGAQVLQRLAQQVRRAENRLVMAEKLATLAGAYGRVPWPGAQLDEAWRGLLLAQHHDCWIVPYIGSRGNTWADKVERWTTGVCQTSEEIIRQATAALAPPPGTNGPYSIRVFNTLGVARTNLVQVPLPAGWNGVSAEVRDAAGRPVASQRSGDAGSRALLFAAPAPALGYSTLSLKEAPAAPLAGATAVRLPDGRVRMETDLYRIELAPGKGGAIRSLIAKYLGNRELVAGADACGFNELRGWFFEQGRYCSSAGAPAQLEIVEAGPVRVRVRVNGQIASNAVTQCLTLAQGEPRLDFNLRIDWQGNPGLGADFEQAGGYRAEHDRKAFYDDRAKLLALFPLNLRAPRIFKDAPFDVTESGLTNTFFETWSGIKNNVILHWVDAYDAAAGVGVALLTDHTTSYAHGADHPLGLTLQYRGIGLWGRGYPLKGPTKVNYALWPHAGDWRKAELWNGCAAWLEPLIASLTQADSGAQDGAKSLLTVEGGGWEVPAMRRSDGHLLLRLFNPSSDARPRTLAYGGPASRIELVQLNGQVIREIPCRREAPGRTCFDLALPPLGLGTLKVTP